MIMKKIIYEFLNPRTKCPMMAMMMCSDDLSNLMAIQPTVSLDVIRFATHQELWSEYQVAWGDGILMVKREKEIGNRIEKRKRKGEFMFTSKRVARLCIITVGFNRKRMVGPTPYVSFISFNFFSPYTALCHLLDFNRFGLHFVRQFRHID